MVIWIATGINWMKKANKGLIASLFKWIDFPFSKVRWQTNVAVLLLNFLYKMLIMVKKSMVNGEDDGEYDGEDDDGDRFDDRKIKVVAAAPILTL